MSSYLVLPHHILLDHVTSHHILSHYISLSHCVLLYYQICSRYVVLRIAAHPWCSHCTRQWVCESNIISDQSPSPASAMTGAATAVLWCTASAAGCFSGSSAFWSSHRQATRSGGSTIDTAHRHHLQHHKELQFQSEPELRVFQLKILVT